MSIPDTTFDFDQLNSDLARVNLTDHTVHFLGRPGDLYDLPIRVTIGYFTDLVRDLPHALDLATPDDGPAEFRVCLEDPAMTLIPELKVFFNLTNWVYTSLMMEAQVDHFKLPI